MIRTFVRSTVSVFAVAAVLSGCSVFHHKDNYYSKAQEQRPLEVSPDLEMPASTNELNVPPAGTPATASATSATPPAAAVIPAASASGSAPIPAMPATSNELVVADSTGNTWDRIGAALEQANIGKITERDPGWKTYTVMVAPPKDGAVVAPAPAPAAPEEHHWYSRVLHPFGGGKANDSAPAGGSSEVKIKVKADATGARVSVRGSADDAKSSDAAHRLVETLRQMLTQQAQPAG